VRYVSSVESATIQRLVEAAIAIGIGTFVGLEREHSDAESRPDAPTEVLLGVRTFALLALFGWMCAAVAPWLVGVGLAVVAALVGLQYFRVAKEAPGLTTEVAAVVTFVLGALVRHDRALAVALGLVTTMLLIAKPFVRRTVPKLRRVELTATLQLAIVLAVVLPLLPAEARDPWGVLSPRKIGLFVVLIAGISYVGYILSRIFGRRRGTGLAGLVGGLASSTAVTAAMAQQAKRVPETIGPGQLATFLANAVMFARVLVVSAVINRRVAVALALPLGLMGLVTLGGALWRWRAVRREGGEGAPDDLPIKNPFALLPALKWGILLSVVLVASAAAREAFGDRGLYAAAAASGLADVDAITLSVGRDAHLGTISGDVAALAITIAVVANTIVKAGIALVTGGRRFGLPIVAVFAAAMALGIVAAAAR
jgi:uncharacterized membrane protein (DUF4010 family)